MSKQSLFFTKISRSRSIGFLASIHAAQAASQQAQASGNARPTSGHPRSAPDRNESHPCVPQPPEQPNKKAPAIATRPQATHARPGFLLDQPCRPGQHPEAPGQVSDTHCRHRASLPRDRPHEHRSFVQMRVIGFQF